MIAATPSEIRVCEGENIESFLVKIVVKKINIR